jgi:hypothetical protein
VDDAEDLLLALALEPLTRGLAGDRLVLADVCDGAELLAAVGAGVDGDDRDARADRRIDGRLQRVRVGHRDHEPGLALCDGVVDELGLRGGVAVGEVGDVDAEVAPRVLGAVLHHAPEGVALAAVGDHREVQRGFGVDPATAAGGGSTPFRSGVG